MPVTGVGLVALQVRDLELVADDARTLHDALVGAGAPVPGAPSDGPIGRTSTSTDPHGYAVTVHDQA